MANAAVASDANTDVQIKLKNEFGNCYDSFAENLTSCIPHTCVYPDLSTAKAWKARIIRGIKAGKCNTVYYSYIGQEIIGDPIYCEYSNKQLQYISSLYRTLFSTKEANKAYDMRERIAKLDYEACKRVPQKKKSS